MNRKRGEKALRLRIRTGKLLRQDVVRRLAELAFGDANDCVKLVLGQEADLNQLDLSLLSEVKRSDKGAVEVRLVDRLRVLEQLAALTGNEDCGLDAFMQSLKSGDEP